MNEKMNEIFEKAKKINLSEKERAEIHARLDSLMLENKIKAISNEMNWMVFFSKHSVSVALILILSLSGATTVLADKALPGDILYPVKTDLNEKVLGFLARSPQAKASWQLTIAERRLGEVEYLAKKPENEKRREEIKNRLEIESENAERLVAEFTESTENALNKELDSRAFSKSSSIQEASQPVSLMMTARAVSDDDLSKETQEIRDSIRNEKKNISELRKSIKEMLKKSPKEAIRARSELLFADKAYFDAEEALSSGDFDLAKSKFEDAKSILSKSENPALRQNLESDSQPEMIEEKNREIRQIDDNASQHIEKKEEKIEIEH